MNEVFLLISTFVAAVSQSQFISCTSINDNTCYINITDGSYSLLCNPQYPNCIINCIGYSCVGGWVGYKELHCPSKNCSKCIINAVGYDIYDLKIHGHNCQLLQINADKQCYYNDIYAPGNGGSLIINQINKQIYNLGVRNNHIYSSNNGSGTENIILNGSGGSNVINGRYVTGHLNFSCVEGSDCSHTYIECGTQSQCNVNCSSSWYKGGCNNMIVYAVNGTANVNWYCRPDMSRVCYSARLGCNNSTNPSYSNLKWDSIAGWYYATPNCAEHWRLPPLSCTFTTDDTCIISRDTYPVSDFSSDLFCDPQYVNCQMRIKGIPHEVCVHDNIGVACGPATIPSIFHCPIKTCTSCKMYCDEVYSCSDAMIMGYDCKLLEIHIRSGHVNVTIYAPGNNGELILFTEFIDEESISFVRSHVYAVPGTKNMVFNFGECSYCYSNVINGTYVTNNMNVLCDGFAECNSMTIICPNDANCNISCSSTYNYISSCNKMNVQAIEGTHDVNWFCNDDNDVSCYQAILECYTGITRWIYNYNESNWEYDISTCIDPPSEAPTTSPTVPSASPTAAPTTAPTISPTAAPSYSPLYFYQPLGFKDGTQFYGVISGSIIGFLLLLSVLIWCIYHYKYKPFKMREEQSMYIRNACVLLIAIGEYDDEIDDEVDIDGYLRNLDGIEYDVKHMQELFHEKLNFDIFPAISQWPKIRWTQKELKAFLEDRANYLENNIQTGKQYDGLVVIISCHGIPRYLCTSDYKKYSKIAVHRTFSIQHAKSREIPRFILYDCCSGNNEKEIADSEEEESKIEDVEDGKNRVHGTTTGKKVETEDIDGSEKQPWIYGEQNPDFMLGRVEAANHGFQSKLDSTFGSLVIYKFYEKYMLNLEKNQQLFIHEIFDEIQSELHGAGKQHPEYVWNDGTQYIKFERHEDNAHSVDEIVKYVAKYQEVNVEMT